MFEPPVVRAPGFLVAIKNMSEGQLGEAMSAFHRLKADYSDDQWSKTELDRFIALCLSKSGQNEAALELLRSVGPRLGEFEYDLSSHHGLVVDLLVSLGRDDEAIEYCLSITGNLRTHDALGHLDWLRQYCLLVEEPGITEFMLTVLALCTIQLGLELPCRSISGDVMCRVVTQCVELRGRGC